MTKIKIWKRDILLKFAPCFMSLLNKQMGAEFVGTPKMVVLSKLNSSLQVCVFFNTYTACTVH